VTALHPMPGDHLPLADRARRAVADPELQQALTNLTGRLGLVAAIALADPNTPAMRERAAAIRREVLADLPGWLDAAQAQLEANGCVVHRAATPADANRVITGLARDHGVQLVVKSKSMATEEIHLNDALEGMGVTALETDLGEYIVQLARERPSHIIGPALHKTLPQVARLFTAEAGRPLPEEREALCEYAREHLRDRFLAADMGVSGANFVAADTGTIVLVTNEGNGRMCTSLPRIHVCVMPVEKVIPRFADLGTLLPLLTRSATGQQLSAYVSMITGPRRAGEVDGPEELHVVFLDHHRTQLVGTPYEEMLACIRCASCLNVCPVYRRIGGHAYGSVYSGPMGAILTPLLSDGEEGRDLPDASSLCGACTEACPVQIPLADLLVRLRADLRRPGSPVAAHRERAASPPEDDDGVFAALDLTADLPVATGETPVASRRRAAFGAWSRLWSSPLGYDASTRLAGLTLGSRRARNARWLRRLPLPLARGWAADRDVPRPATARFRDRWDARLRGPGGGSW